MILAAVCVTGTAFGQGISFETGEWADVRAKAGGQGRLIFIDLYTTWCWPCKTMSSEVFPQQEVGEYFNANFVNYKTDAEKGEGVELAKQYSVTAYPTFVFTDAGGNLVYRFEGARDAGRLIKEGAKALEIHALAPQLADFAQQYAEGNRKVTFLGNYWNLLNRSGREGGAVLNDYLKALPDIELFRVDRAADIEKISETDAGLYDRLADYTLGLDPAEDKALRNKLTSAILKSLSATLRTSIDNNDTVQFEELLTLKRRFPGTDSPVLSMMGGGVAYLSEPQIRLSYYAANKMDKEFRATMESYMPELMATERLDSLRMQEAQVEAMIGQAKVTAAEKNDPSVLEAALRLQGMVNMFQGAKLNILSAIVLDTTEHYQETGSEGAANDNARVITWAEYGYGLDRNLASATAAAGIIEKAGDPARARSVLAEAIALAEKEGSGADPGQIEEAKARMDEIE